MGFEIDYLALMPEFVIVGTLLVVFALDMILPRPKKYWIATAAITGTALAAVPLVILAADGTSSSMFDGSYVVDEFALILKGLFLVGAYLVFLMSHHYIESDRYYQGEYYFLLLSSVLGMILMSSARDLVTVFLALELLSIPTYMLAGWRKRDLIGNEAGVKYYLIGAFTSASMLIGIAYLFGLAGSTTLPGLARGLPSGGLALVVGAALVILAVAFKIGAVPAHAWMPDVAQGSPAPVAAFVTSIPKVGGLVFLARLVLPAMAAAGQGLFVTIGSVADHRALPGNAAYAASKHGARGLHEALVEEYRGTGVRCTLVSPGPTDTGAWDAVDVARWGIRPRDTMLRPADVAEAVRWLASLPGHVHVDWLRLGPA